MSTTPDTQPDIEQRLRAALSARAELVQPEDLSHHAMVVPLRRRWTKPLVVPLVVLASAACVLLVLVLTFQLTDSPPRTDEVAPRPDAPQVVLPADVGRDWKSNDLSTPARLDLDGDGAKEKVVFLAEPTKDFDGRIRLQTTLSTTGGEAYGIAQLSSTIGTTALEPIDADSDGDQELVLYYDDLEAVGGGGYPLVFDLRDGLLVQAVAEDPDLLVRGQVPVPGAATEFYDLVRIHDYGIEGGRLVSSRSVNAFAAGGMSLLRPESIVLDSWAWVLGADGVLRTGEPRCLRQGPEFVEPCEPGAVDDPPVVAPVADETFGTGEQTDFDEGYAFTASVEAVADPSLVVTGSDGRTVNFGLEVADPRISTVQPTSLFYDGASVVVTSGSDPAYVEVLVQDGDTMRALQPIGEIALANGGEVRTWLTQNGALVSVVAQEGGSWQVWQWVGVSRTEMAAFPTGTVCFDDVGDPSTAAAC